MTDPFRARVAAVAASLPGVTLGDPAAGAHEAWKVGGKMFACFGSMAPGVSVKCADIETAGLLIETGLAERAPYFHRSWVRLPETVTDEELRHRVLTSYRLVRAGLSAGLRNSFPDMPEV